MTTPTRRPTTLLVTLATSALLLAGCSEEAPAPKFAETPTAEPTPVEQEETAEEFIRRWNDEQTEMQKGDTQRWREMTRRCDACLATADTIDSYYKAGGAVVTEGRTIVSIKKSDRSPNLKHAYLVRVNSAPTTYKESADASPQTLDGGRAVYEVQLEKAAGVWQFVDYWQVPS